MANLEREIANHMKELQNIGSITFEVLPPYSEVKIFKKNYPIIYEIDAYAAYKENGEINAIARFVADIAGGSVTVLIITVGTESVQPELIAVAFVAGNLTEELIRDFYKACGKNDKI